MNNENITRIKAVYANLEELADDVVFVGGATVALYADRPAGEARPTDDVDILVELLHYRDYAAIEERLCSKGFANDTESGVICRYRIQGIVADVMPTGENALVFTDRWYGAGYAHSIVYDIDEEHRVRIFSPGHLLASKREAFTNRGGGDGRWSSDSDFRNFFIVLSLKHRFVTCHSCVNKQESAYCYLWRFINRIWGQEFFSSSFHDRPVITASTASYSIALPC